MISDGFNGLGGDLSGLVTEDGPIGWFFLLVLGLLPVLGIVLVLRGSRLAWGSVTVFGALMVVWFLYHATDWWSNPGGPQGALMVMSAMAVGWIVLAVAAWSLRRRRRGVVAQV